MGVGEKLNKIKMEPKGSLFLRSNHMDYGKDTLVTNWHQGREAEPKDYDIQSFKNEGRNLHRSTYKRIGNVTSGELPNSTSHAHMEQIKLKHRFQEQVRTHPMVNLSSFNKVDLDRDLKSTGNGVLPRHPPEHGKRYMDTIYKTDYIEPYPYTSREQNQDPEIPDNSAAYKKCHSQFTDTADYRRYGQNTWQDETGIYANLDAKRTVFAITNPIGERHL